MDHARWQLSGPVAGMAFVVFLALTIALTGGAPMPEKGVPDLVRWYSHHHHRVEVATMFGALASVLFLWFLAHLRRLLVGRSAEFDWLSAVLTGSGVATATLGAFNGIFVVALDLAVNRPSVRADSSMLRMLNDLDSLFHGPLTILISLFMLALGLALTNRAFAAPWLTIPSFLASLLALIGGIAAFYPNTEGKMNPASILGFIGLLLALLTILVTSVLLATHTGRRKAPAA